MVSLILVVISIGLMAAMVASIVPSISLDAVMRQSIQKETDYGLRLLEFGATRYLDAHRDTLGDIIYPGDGINMKPLISPQFGFIPADVRNELTWQVTTSSAIGQPAVGICVYPIGQSTEAQRRSMVNIQRGLPVSSSYVGSGCNATSNVANGTALTYWVVVAHVN